MWKYDDLPETSKDELVSSKKEMLVANSCGCLPEKLKDELMVRQTWIPHNVTIQVPTQYTQCIFAKTMWSLFEGDWDSDRKRERERLRVRARARVRVIESNNNTRTVEVSKYGALPEKGQHVLFSCWERLWISPTTMVICPKTLKNEISVSTYMSHVTTCTVTSNKPHVLEFWSCLKNWTSSKQLPGPLCVPD